MFRTRALYLRDHIGDLPSEEELHRPTRLSDRCRSHVNGRRQRTGFSLEISEKSMKFF